MSESTNKKRTAVIAAATAAALVLTGTVAWNMATDQTKLNEFTEKDPGKYEVELDENFDTADPWLNKDVFVKNNGDNPVIVRVRLEEFYDLTYRNGTDYNVAEGYSQTPPTEGSSAIFKADALTASTGQDGNNYKAADSSTHLTDKVALNFNEGVATMAEYNAMDDTAKAAIKWVVDSDGWCYYTRALLAGETTEYLLDDVDFNEEIFDAAYDAPYNLDYKINVRLQAISADLDDFGSHLNDEQWTNVAYIDNEGNEITDNAGRIIADDADNNYEILDNSTITDEALELVVKIKNDSNIYRNEDTAIAVSVSTAEELKAALTDKNVHSVLLTENITTSDFFQIGRNKLIELGDYKLTGTKPGGYLLQVYNNAEVIVRHGTVDLTNGCNFSIIQGGTVKLVDTDVNADSNCQFGLWLYSNASRVEMYNSSIISQRGIMHNPGTDNSSIYLDNSSVISTLGAATVQNGDGAKNVNVVIRNNSYVEGAGSGLWLSEGWTLDARDSEIVAKGAKDAAILENHNASPKNAYLENVTLTAKELGYYKVGDYPLVMKNCTVNVTAADGARANGMFIRSGDVTLDNVNINVNKGTGEELLTDEYLNSKYADGNEATRNFSNYEALQIVLNSYDSINLNIIGGSYTTNVDGAKSVYIYDEGYNIHTEGSSFEYPYTFANTITVSGAPTFTPTFTFADSYKNTTVTK
ncbi:MULTISPECIES: hypothetical protein [unclassified Ruminococcus]|uniref:hypothetical protein n=1 Tax=unclassified Ruminococcus TaxID=2608920 RepID=UPI00210BDFAD|nr:MULTISPECIES: hypothetical protein [unclassified Ruminococcus]MCQ4022482.1 hypothetical protein [Ruminococcus sp. zg-924]MCQ4115176.1 hypothetical protein [Ruminococcus sp. zg-921]